MSWHRRSLAAVAAALAVLAGVSAARPEGPPRVTAVVLQDELPGGAVLRPTQVEGREVLASDAPEGFLASEAGLVGRTLAAPAAKGQILTELDLVSTRSPVASGHVVAPLRLADPGLVRLLRTGDVVDVLAADEQSRAARLVAQAVRVVTVPAVDDTSPEASGALVLVEVSLSTATALAQAAANGSLTVTWR